MKIIASDESTLTLIPFLHGKIAFTEYVRACCLSNRFDCIAVDIPAPFEPYMTEAIDDLPVISAVIAQNDNDTAFFVPIDPCDAAIEAIRQSRQNHIPFFCVGAPRLRFPEPLPPLPDAHAIAKLGFDEYTTLCIRTIGNCIPGTPSDIEARHISRRLHALRKKFARIAVLVHMRHFTRTVYHFNVEKTHTPSLPPHDDYALRREYINPDHLYFILGELPFITAAFEKTRYEPFAEPVDIVANIKNLFRETRDEFLDDKRRILSMPPARIQRALQFLRNLTVMDGRLIPNLFDIVLAAKGVGGNSYALQTLKCARYYPYFSPELDAPLMAAGIDKIMLPGETAARPAINCFKDFQYSWHTLSIKPDATELQKKKYRFSWNPRGMCSHIPEDRRIEDFNTRVRAKALSLMREDAAVAEKFTVSIRDGIDMRETLSKWYSGDLYVKEVPPSRGAIDTVVIIFDAEHDERYPHCATWYAEHEEESTLTFYSTDPASDCIGPGVARSRYGGLCLLFPPRPIPNIFEIALTPPPGGNAEYLTIGALMFGKERRVAYVAKTKPGLRLRKLAATFQKRLIWIPLSTFNSDTIQRLRTFHILNGKEVRSWAARFIGD